MTPTVSFSPFDHAPLKSAFPKSPSDSSGLQQLRERMRQAEGLLTSSGREAISMILDKLDLERHDEIWILTTFDFPNVSSCVTCTIFNRCKPSRVLTNRTRAIYIIHEFGVPHRETPQLVKIARQRGIPVIEDCAHTVDSRCDGWHVGNLGDYVVLSFPKVFPTTTGGALLSRTPVPATSLLNDHEARELDHRLAVWLADLAEESRRRRTVFRQLTDRFQQMGLSPLFDATEEITPWFFPVRTPLYREMFAESQKQGVDCGMWHGTDVVVFPCHQFLSSDDVHRVCEVAGAVCGR